LALSQDNQPEAVQWAESCGLLLDDRAEYSRYPGEYATLARVFIAQGRFLEALDLLEQMQAVAEETGRHGRLLESLMLRALALSAQGHTEQALPPLVRALSLAEPGGYVRTFADEGTPIAQLLTLVKARGMAPEEAYVDKLLAAIGFEERPGQPAARPRQASTFPLIEPLSERELEVLSLVAAGLSNREIAAKLVIAEGTVKKHLHNIFGKLNVRSRTQAVMRASELGLL
jgi:LuxR family maltose regulon positive regulatory protein